ncbi:MAG: hypothetical protein Phyf2KO_04670 [Phycisphaerales bacterium]
MDSAGLLDDLTDPGIALSTRIQLSESVKGFVNSGEINRDDAVEKMKAIAWMRHTPQPLRVEAIDQLLEPEGLLTDLQGIAFVNSLMPTETDPIVRHRVSELSVIRGWKEVTQALIRSLAKADTSVPDQARPEYMALLELHPDQSIEEIVFDIFKDQGDGGVSRLRRDSWNLLSRLDADGEIRVELLAGLLDTPPNEDDQTLSALRKGLLDFRTIPLTGEELEWLTDLYTETNDGTEDWWAESASVVASLGSHQQRGIRLRHLEALRWASRNRSEWLTQNKADLDSVLSERLDNREHRRRSGDVIRFRSEKLDAWRDQLGWADYITALVIDDAIETQRIRSALFTQAETDRRDETTEYGGIVRISIRDNEPDTYVAADYPPKPVMRESDTSFVASPEMFREGTRALAHYHFHAQKHNNGRYAGPSFGDMKYAATYGRACLVFTFFDETTMGVDMYQPDGVVIDLGMIKKPEESN